MEKITYLTDEQRKAANPLVSAWVQANAGTGKTKLLVARLLQILFRTKLRPNQTILCLTYTKAGAGEMRNRITKALKEWSVANDHDLSLLLDDVVPNEEKTPEYLSRARSIFYQYIDNPDMLKVKTIHSFCEDILHRFPTEAGLAPSWSVVTDVIKENMQQEVFDKMLVSNTLDERTREVLEDALEEYTETSFKNLQNLITKYSSAFVDVENIDNYRNYFIETIKKILNMPDDAPAEYDENSIKTALANYPTEKPSATLRDYISLAERYLNHEIEFDEYRKTCITGEGKIRSHLAKSPELIAELERVRNVVAYSQKQNIYKKTMKFFDLTATFAKEYHKLKKIRNVLDFDDMILYTNRLFSNRDIMGWILSQLDTSLSHILIDEAQDTGVDQWNLLNNLTENFFTDGDVGDSPRTMLVVGDSKQAIYGFQNANPKAFENSHRMFEDRLKNSGREYQGDTNLTTSFRSTLPILEIVDTFFNDDEIRQRFNFVNNDHKCYSSKKKGLVEIYALETKQPSDENTDMMKARYMNKIAKKIKELIDSGKYKASDIMILVRKRDPYATGLARRLRKLDIELAGEDRIILPEFPVIVDLLNLVRFCLDTGDDYSLGCILKSPIFALSEADIYKVCQNRNEEYKKLKEADGNAKFPRLFEFVQDAYPEIYERLMEYRSKMKYMGPYAFFSYVLDNDNTREKMVAALGKPILEPLREFMTLCLAYERTQPGTLKHFLKWFVTGGSSVKRDLSASDVTGVRILTIHGSKGLEAPVVFLVDTMTDIKKENAPLDVPDDNLAYRAWLCLPEKKLYSCVDEVKELVEQRKQGAIEESFRLLYVAMTRPKTELYIYGCAAKAPKEKEDGFAPSWHTMLWNTMRNKEGLSIKITEEKIRISNE